MIFGRHFTSPWIGFAALAVLVAGIAVAQTGDAEITGAVKDPSGAPIASASITLLNQESGVTRKVTTDAEGRYRFVAVPPGRYSLKTEATGFKAETMTDIVLNIDTHVERNIPLTVGSVQEAITVNGEVPSVDPASSSVGGVVRNDQIASLPTNSRQFLNLALLMPGTTQDASRTFYNNVQMSGGARFYANGFSVDGVSNTWAEQGEPRQNIPLGAVQEFKVNTNQFKAEQGLAMGGIITVVTKSGTNQFHGDAFEFFRNSALNHDNTFQEQALQLVGATGKAPYNRNQYGFDVGGPIVKDRAHFYAAYERTQIDDSFTIFTGTNGHPFYSANEGVFNKPSYDQMFNLRGDLQISSNQHMFGRYSQEWNMQTWQTCTNASESNCYDGLIPRHAAVIGHTWTPTARIVNDFRFQYGYSSYLLGPSGQPIFTELGSYPAARLAELSPVYSFPSFAYGQGYGELGTETRWQFKDDVNIIRGNHNFKLGFDFSHIPFADDTVINYQGTWTFATDQPFNPKDPGTIANLKNPTQFTAAIPPQYTPVPVSQYAAYLQDDWKVRPDLTLSLGLRWDREIGSFNEDVNPASFAKTIPFLGDPSQRGKPYNFGPRFGLAWNVKGNTRDVIRAGFGLYYNNIQTLLNFPENRNLSQCNVLIKNPTYPNPYGNQSPTAFCSSAAPTVTVLDKDFANPYSEQFTLGYSRQVTRDLSVHVDGVYMHTLRDWRTVDMNFPNAAGVRPLPDFARVLDHKSISQSKYKALFVRVERRLANRYQFNVSYTLASARDDNPQAQVVTPSNYNLDWGPANIDRRQSLVASGSVELPWKVNFGAIWNLRSALPFSALSATQDVDGTRQYVPGTSRNQGNRGLGLDIINSYRASLGLAPIAASNIDTSRFNSFDVRVSRPIFVKGERRIDVIGQVLNLFGTTNLTGGNTTRADSANYGRILGASNLQQGELGVRIVF